MFFTKLRNRLN